MSSDRGPEFKPGFVLTPRGPHFWIGVGVHVFAALGGVLLGAVLGTGQGLAELLMHSGGCLLRIAAIGFVLGLASCSFAATVRWERQVAAYLWIGVSTFITLVVLGIVSYDILSVASSAA